MSKKKVLSKLLEDHIGEQNAISHSDLSEALAVSQSSVADLVQEIRDDTDLPALGTNKGGNSGTYVIADKTELQEQIAVWNKEKERITDRIENTLESFDSEYDTPEPENPCEKCGGGIEGDAYLWFSVELCQECYEKKPPSENEFKQWVEA